MPSLNPSRRRLLQGMASLPLAGLPLARAYASGSDWPTARPISIIVPSASGGAADFIARTFANHVPRTLPGATVVVDNRPGAAGILGTLATKSAAADGYTFMLTSNSTHAANVSLYRHLRYDPLKDFVQIGMFGRFSSVLLVRADAPFRSLSDLIAAARSQPGKLNYGYYSSSSQVPAELLRVLAKLDFQGASYKSVTQILTDLMGGQLDFVFIDTLSAAPALQNDPLRPIAVSSPQPLPTLAQVPAAQTVVPGLEVQGWFGLAAPAGTPAVAVEGMGRALQQAMADSAVQQAFSARGFENQWRSGPDLQRFIQDDIRRWAKWVDLAGIERL
ncbi:tripartite tricarboxylate transporter substrate binding protein [Comamonas piscis]